MLDFSKNHFELFDLPVGFAVDAKRLAERYRTLQSVAHPDRVAVAADHDKALPSQAADQINEAYRTLKDPLARAVYLLALHGGQEEFDDAQDGALLMERLELRETIAEAHSSPNPRASVARLLTQWAERSLVLDKELECLFADPTVRNLEAAQEILRKRRLLELCRREAEALPGGA